MNYIIEAKISKDSIYMPILITLMFFSLMLFGIYSHKTSYISFKILMTLFGILFLISIRLILTLIKRFEFSNSYLIVHYVFFPKKAILYSEILKIDFPVIKTKKGRILLNLVENEEKIEKLLKKALKEKNVQLKKYKPEKTYN